MMDKVEKFKLIFSGLDRAYGQYKSEGQKSNGKISGKAFIIKESVTDKLWTDHIEKKDPSLGIIPIRDDSTCSWGCIDVDTYPLDYKKIISQIRELKLPLVMCRSKSGGAHIFIFLKEPVQAGLVRDKLTEWAAEIGYANCEIFPKQVEIRADRGDTGNFLNLPYHGGDDTNRYAFNDDGSGSSLDEFFQLYDTYAVDQETLLSIKVKRKKEVKELEDGPPCLATLMSQGIPEGGRDNTLYQYAVYAKKKWPDDWQNKIDEFNHKYMERPLGSAQVQKTVTQHEKKEYQYKCKDQPMCAVCSPVICRSRQYGIGDSFEHSFSDLTKFQSDQSVWFLNVDGYRIVLETEELFDQNKFRKACMDKINIIPNAMRPNSWTTRLQQLLRDVEIIEMPKEIRKEGRFKTLLEQFLDDQGAAMDIDEILIGKAWFDEGKAYFKTEALQDFLEKKRFKDFSPTQIAAVLKNLGGGHARKKVKNKTTFMWYVPYTRKKEESLSIPNLEDKAPF
tara:strand:+ start:296 stop:1810 length:1515 start_codon:yes stop_codon:yes gene_type:complete